MKVLICTYKYMMKSKEKGENMEKNKNIFLNIFYT